MIFVLDATNKALKFTVSAGTDVHFTSHWADATASGLTEGQTQGVNTAGPDDVVPAPASSTRRVVKLITFHNTSTTTSRTVTLVNDVGGTSRTIAVFTLAPLATWYSDTAATTAIADGDKGDITVSGSGATWTIDSDAVTYAKMQNVSADRVLGRRTSIGDPEELTLSQTLDLVGSAAQGDILYRGASTWTRLGAGTRGRYLQTGDAGANLSWATAGMYKNALINGDMRIAQRGTSYTSTTTTTNSDQNYVLDRWYLLSDGNNRVTVAQSTTAPAGRINSIELKVVSGQTNRKFGIAQIIERRNCIHLTDTSVSLSFKVLISNTRLSNIRAAVFSYTGTADAPTASVRDVVSSWNDTSATNNPTFVTTSLSVENTATDLAIPSANTWYTQRIENISIDTVGTNNIIVFIWSNAISTQADDAVYLTDIQLEPGPVATEYEYLPFEIQEYRSKRYFQSLVGTLTNERFGVASGYITNGGIVIRPLTPAMRVAPTGTWGPLLGTTSTTTSFGLYDGTDRWVSAIVNNSMSRDCASWAMTATGLVNGVACFAYTQKPAGSIDPYMYLDSEI